MEFHDEAIQDFFQRAMANTPIYKYVLLSQPQRDQQEAYNLESKNIFHPCFLLGKQYNFSVAEGGSNWTNYRTLIIQVDPTHSSSRWDTLYSSLFLEISCNEDLYFPLIDLVLSLCGTQKWHSIDCGSTGRLRRDSHLAAPRLPAPHVVPLLQIRTSVEEESCYIKILSFKGILKSHETFCKSNNI